MFAGHTPIFKLEELMVRDTRRALWKEWIEKWRESGLTQRAFAQQHGLHARQISYWVKQFAKIDAIPHLIPVRIKPGNLASGMLALTLRSPSGWSVTIPSGQSAAWLGELLQSLR